MALSIPPALQCHLSVRKGEVATDEAVFSGPYLAFICSLWSPSGQALHNISHSLDSCLTLKTNVGWLKLIKFDFDDYVRVTIIKCGAFLQSCDIKVVIYLLAVSFFCFVDRGKMTPK